MFEGNNILKQTITLLNDNSYLIQKLAEWDEMYNVLEPKMESSNVQISNLSKEIAFGLYDIDELNLEIINKIKEYSSKYLCVIGLTGVNEENSDMIETISGNIKYVYNFDNSDTAVYFILSIYYFQYLNIALYDLDILNSGDFQYSKNRPEKICKYNKENIVKLTGKGNVAYIRYSTTDDMSILDIGTVLDETEQLVEGKFDCSALMCGFPAKINFEIFFVKMRMA